LDTTCLLLLLPVSLPSLSDVRKADRTPRISGVGRFSNHLVRLFVGSPLPAALLSSRLLGEHCAGPRYAGHFAAPPAVAERD
jgi:hypothetical protein